MTEVIAVERWGYDHEPSPVEGMSAFVATLAPNPSKAWAMDFSAAQGGNTRFRLSGNQVTGVQSTIKPPFAWHQDLESVVQRANELRPVHEAEARKWEEERAAFAKFQRDHQP